MAKQIEHTIELPGVYDGISIYVYTDGTIRNRWAEPDGTPTPSMERRYEATQRVIDQMQGESQ